MEEKEVKEPVEKPSFLVKCAKDFVMGCLAFIPMAVFAFLLFYMFRVINHLVRFLFGVTDSTELSVAIGLFILIVITYTGRKIRRREKWLLDILDNLIEKIPVMGGWYRTFRELIQTFTRNNENSYLGTAQVPCGAGYIIGFVTKRETDSDGRVTVSVFVPTSPNPTTGLVFFFPEEAVTYINMSPERAFSKIISLGTK